MFNSPEDKIERWKGDQMFDEDPPSYVKRLWEVQGIAGISVDKYDIQLTKGSAFDWNEMLTQIISILNLELFPQEEPEPIGAAKRPSKRLLKALRARGCDV